jgi:hypothetical protein
MGNVKIMRLSASAFRLWVHGLSYCQVHLTDGLIPREALRFLAAKRADVDMLCSVLVDGKAPLWEIIDGFGFKVHDYLEWNDSKELIEKKRQGGRDRMSRYRTEHLAEPTYVVSNAVSNALRNAHSASGVVLSTNVSPIQNPEGVQGKPSVGDVRSLPEPRRAPRRDGDFGRIYLHRWQQESLIAVLGPHANTFGLDVWLDDLNQRIAHQALPPDPWKFVKAELYAELDRRGLAVAAGQPQTPTNKRISGLMTGGEAFLNRNRRSS